MSTLRPDIALRPITAQDQAFVFDVFAAHRRGHFAAAGLPERQLEQLLRLQFEAQQTQYRTRFPHADCDLICIDGMPVGYVYVDRDEQAFTLIDIALLPERTGRGLGGQLTRELVREASLANKPVRAHVGKDNRAWKLWQRLGFHITSDDGVHLAIECPPQPPPS